MATYKLIIRKLLNTENNIFSSQYDTTDTVDENCKLFFNIFLDQPQITIKSKFEFFNESINSIFLTKKTEEFINYFCKIQKVYKALNKFIYICKIKRSKTVVNTDMALNQINSNEKNTICILHNNAKYLFIINDLIQIINAALTNHYLFFSEPICIKNPYDNLAFTKSNLYNIYLYIKYQTHYHPDLFFYFFNVDFNLGVFKTKYEYLLREYSIKNYVYKSPSNILLVEINQMIKEFNSNCERSILKNRIVIDKDFPNDKLIRIMKPYLLMYFYSNYSLLTHVKMQSKYSLKKSLLKFNNYNPQFGRKKIKILMKTNNKFKKRIVGKITEFDDNHIKLSNIEIVNERFLVDHLNYVEINDMYSNEIYIINEQQEHQEESEESESEYSQDLESEAADSIS